MNVLMVGKGNTNKVVFVPYSIMDWLNKTAEGSVASNVIELPQSVQKEVNQFFGKEVDPMITYRSLYLEEDVINHFYKQGNAIVGVKKAEEIAKNNGWEVVDDFYIGNEFEFEISELSK